MQVKGTHHYKVQTVGSKAETVDPWGTSSEEEQRRRIEEYFEHFGKAPGSAQSPGTGPYNPIDSWLMGMTADNTAYGADAEFERRLEIPSLEEIVAGSPSATRRPDLILQFFEKTRISLGQLKESYASALASGDVPPADKVTMTSRFDLITRTLAKVDAQIKKVGDLKTKLEASWQQELEQGIDLDGDNKLADEIGIIHNKDGTTTYIDLMTKRPIPFIRDRKYSWPLADAASMTILGRDDKDETHPKGDEKGEYDLRLKLTEDSLTTFSADNIYKTPIDLHIPQYIAVRKDGAKMKTAEDALGVEKAIPLKYIVKDGKIRQDTSDMKDAMQVVVTRVEVRSEESGNTTADGIALNDQVVELYNHETLLARIRIEGFATNGASPAAVATSQGFNYVSACAVGMSVNGDGLAGPIEVDASEATFHVEHRMKEADLTKILGDAGVRRPTGTDDKAKRGQAAYDANINPFKADPNAQYLDAFIADPQKDADKATGLFVYGMRGNLSLDSAMNFVITSGANEYSKYIEENRSEDQPKLKFDDPLYYNFVDLGDDNVNNVAIAKQGNNVIRNASFAWINSEGNDTNWVYTPKPSSDNSDSTKYAEQQRNPRVFLYGQGGKYYIDNPSDKDYARANKEEEDAINGAPPGDAKAKTKAGRDATEKALKEADDDYFKVERGSAYYSDAEDDDIIGKAFQGMQLETMDSKLAEKEDEWRSALDEPIEYTPEEIDNSWREIELQATMDSEELNAFFEERDKELNSFQSELDDFLGRGGGGKPGVGE